MRVRRRPPASTCVSARPYPRAPGAPRTTEPRDARRGRHSGPPGRLPAGRAPGTSRRAAVSPPEGLHTDRTLRPGASCSPQTGRVCRRPAGGPDFSGLGRSAPSSRGTPADTGCMPCSRSLPPWPPRERSIGAGETRGLGLRCSSPPVALDGCAQDQPLLDAVKRRKGRRDRLRFRRRGAGAGKKRCGDEGGAHQCGPPGWRQRPGGAGGDPRPSRIRRAARMPSNQPPSLMLASARAVEPARTSETTTISSSVICSAQSHATAGTPAT